MVYYLESWGMFDLVLWVDYTFICKGFTNPPYIDVQKKLFAKNLC